MTEPGWLTWARELQAIAQTGLFYSTVEYDRERYEQVRAVASAMLAAHTASPTARIDELFAGQTGYATPKVDVRGAAFDDAGRLLMVREAIDGHRWTLPGGWADVNLTPAENIVKEMREETGFETRVRKLAAVLDRTRQGHSPDPFSCYKLFFVLDIAGGDAAVSHETSEIGWFAEHELPEQLSRARVLPSQLRCMFEHAHNPGRPTDFE